MTVCLAALCGNGEDSRVVVAADRMVSAGGFMEFEHRGSKIVELADHALVMVAGDTNEGMRLVHQAAAEIGDSTPVPGIAEDLGERYATARLRRAEQSLLGTRGLDLNSYYQVQGTLNPQMVAMIDNGFANWDLGVELLLAGVDESGAHIHTNHNPGGGNQDHRPVGWTSIGSGAIHVIPSMAGFEHAPHAGYGQTLFRVYASKRRAEVAPGVGHETDVAVVSREGIKRLTSQELQQLDSIYENFLSTTSNELAKQLDSFDPEGTQVMNRPEDLPFDSARPTASNPCDPEQALTRALLEEQVALANAGFGAPPQTEVGGMQRQPTEGVSRPSPATHFAR